MRHEAQMDNNCGQCWMSWTCPVLEHAHVNAKLISSQHMASCDPNILDQLRTLQVPCRNAGCHQHIALGHDLLGLEQHELRTCEMRTQ